MDHTSLMTAGGGVVVICSSTGDILPLRISNGSLMTPFRKPLRARGRVHPFCCGLDENELTVASIALAPNDVLTW